MATPERLIERPSLDEALESIGERVEYAVRLATEAYSTPDGEDESGKIDPIFPYAEHIIKDTVPLAIMGLFLLVARATTQRSATQSVRDDK